MFDAKDAMKQITFKRIVYLNESNKILEEDLEIIIIEKEVVKEIMKTKAEGKQTLSIRKVMKHTMRST